jgi:iron complex outermembrane receptor protein
MTTKTRTKRTYFLAGCSAAAIVGALPVGAALAQEDQIVVTAQKREESIQNVPLAISAYSGDFVRETNLDDIKDLVKFAPGVSGNSFDSFIDFINIRGIRTNDFGVGGDPSIPFFKNGLYQGRNGAVVSSNFDMERAEVLRGPQGFLFGRNAIGGAISVYTARPKLDAYSGYAELDIGERDRIFGEAAVNLPLSENFAVRIAGYGGHEDGYVTNFARPGLAKQNEPEKYAGRFSALYSKDNVEALFTAEYENRRQSGTLYRATEMGDQWQTLVDLFGVSLQGGGRDIDSDQGLGEGDNAKVASFGFQLDVDLGAATFTSLTGYKDHEFDYAEDFDGTPLRINDYAQDQEGEYFEQELRLVSNGDGPLSWYVGASYYHESIDVLFSQGGDEEVMCAYYLSYYGFSTCEDYFAYYYYYFTPSPEGLLERNQVRGRYHGWAGYIDVNYQLTDRFDIGVGVRYAKDTKKFGINALPVSSELGPFFALGFTTTDFLTDKASWDAFTPRFIARYHPSDDWMVFASATRGFKAGGFGSFSIIPDTLPFTAGGVDLAPGDAMPDPFDPEKAWSYETGVKGVLGGGAVRLDANAFYYTYKDLQQTIVGTGGGIIVENIGRVKGWGLEGSMDADLGPYLGVQISGAYTDTEATRVQDLCDGLDDCEGLSLQQVPKYSGSVVGRFNYPLGPGHVHAAAELVAQSKTYGGPAHLAEAVNPGYHDLSLRFGYVGDAGWSIIGYVENVTDELYYTGSEEPGGIIPAHFIGPSRPRTWGARMTYEFGG